jgi:hypothetical protein
MKEKLALVIFGISVLLLTKLDFLINNVLYGFGLSFSEAWYHEYMVLYFLAYQLIAFVLYAYTRNLKLLAFFEVFVLTSSQDLVYFGLWEMSFPATAWTWTIYYRIFGFWNTTNQILLSVTCLAFSALLIRVEILRTRLLRSPNQTPLCGLSRFLTRFSEHKGGSAVNEATKKWNRIKHRQSYRMTIKNWTLRARI